MPVIRAILLCVLSLVSRDTFGQSSVAPAPNWGIPTYLQEYPLPALNNYQSQTPFVGGPCSGPAPNGGLNFSFTIRDSGAIPATVVHPAARGALSTSAVIYDATTDTLAATLWNSITISDGTYCGVWNGFLDSGTAPTHATPNDRYQVRILHNNIQFTWDGMVGVTESSLGGNSNWDSATSFPSGISFMMFPGPDGHPTDWGLVAGGYNEGQFEAQVFKNFDTITRSGDPTTVWPLNLALSTGNEFDFTATDGHKVYFAEGGSNPGSANSAVVAFSLTNSLPPLGKPALHTEIRQNADGSQTAVRVPIASYGQPPWGIPYIFPSVTQPIPGYMSPATMPSHFVNVEANVPLISPETQTRTGSNKEATFVNGISIRRGVQAPVPPAATAEVDAQKAEPGTPAITGIAVQRESTTSVHLLAVAHGQPASITCAFAFDKRSSIEFFDKDSGALLTTIPLTGVAPLSITANPQKMAFDREGNLWVIDGGKPAADCSNPTKPIQGNRSQAGLDPLWSTYGRLLKMSFSRNAGSSQPIVSSITVISKLNGGALQLSNPVDVTVSPTSGHIFVADGGVNQQVIEFDGNNSSIYSATGAAGGYGQSLPASSSSACKATVDNYTFWLDFVTTDRNIRGVGEPWIAVDNEDNLWVGDSTTSRILQYRRVNGKFLYLRNIQMGRFHYYVAVPRGSPGRVFAGFNGFLEYAVDYPQPDPAASSTPPASNDAFASNPSRNWLPCFLREEWKNGGYPDTTVFLSTVEDINGKTIGAGLYHSANAALYNRNVVVQLPENGILVVKDNGIPPGNLRGKYPYFDSHGNYSMILATNGACSGGDHDRNRCATFTQYTVTGADDRGFPVWDAKGSVVAQATLKLDQGDPCAWCGQDGCDGSLTTNGIVTAYSGNGWQWHVPSKCRLNDSSCSLISGPTYHLAGVTTNTKATKWHSQLEANIEYETLVNDPSRGTPSLPVPGSKVNNLGLYSAWLPYAYPGYQNMGVNAHNIDNLILTLINGNWQEFGGQFHLYSDDGMLLGQFGWRATGYYPGTGRHGGAPTKMLVESLAPGNTTNPVAFKIVKVNGDYYMYVTDEGYRAGIQRWHIWNFNSTGCESAATNGSLKAQTTALVLQDKAGFCSD